MRWTAAAAALALALALAPAHAAARNEAADRRAHAAEAAAEQSRACRRIRPFYWEVGDAQRIRASGRAGHGAPMPTRVMPIASASTWVFAALVAELRRGQLSEADTRALTMRSGYTDLTPLRCTGLLPFLQRRMTVNECFHDDGNDRHYAHYDNRFFYNGGHYQKYAAVDLGLGDYDARELTELLQRGFREDFGFSYGSPQVAAGLRASGLQYGAFLRAVLAGRLFIAGHLGVPRVCAQPTACPDAASTPLTPERNWHYSLGHWVEDDPRHGDGAFSSAGALGFYPWIDADQTSYGVVARRDSSRDAAVRSAECGQAIRRAWLHTRES